MVSAPCILAVNFFFPFQLHAHYMLNILCAFSCNNKKKLTARMHRVENFKIINAEQVKLINNYRNTKYKLLKTNAATWYNKICRNSQLIPKYVDIKIKGHNAVVSLKMV
jgi:hypothetical protein